MEYQKFIAELKKKLTECRGFAEDSLDVYMSGYAGKNEKERAIIQKINHLASQTGSDVLTEDYICIRGGESKKQICLFLTKHLYMAYLGQGWGRVLEMIDEGTLVLMDESMEKLPDYLKDYDTVKDRLIMQIQRSEKYNEASNSDVCKEIGDMELVLCLVMEQTDRHLKSMRIPRSLLRHWKTDQTEVIEKALENTMKLFPPIMYRSSEEFYNVKNTGEEYMELTDTKVDMDQAPVFTTSNRLSGATSFFYPGVKERIAEMMGGDYYAVFISPHWVRIFHAEVWSAQALVRSLILTNGLFDEKESLSGNIYRYRAGTGTLETVGPEKEGDHSDEENGNVRGGE